jgi:hypothetical protein
MSGDDGVLADHRHAAKATPARWTSLSLLASLLGISVLVDAISLIADIMANLKSLRRALEPVVVQAAPAGGGTSNAVEMHRIGFSPIFDSWPQTMHLPLQLLLYALASCWIYQAVSNVNARGASGVGRAGWVVTWFFIPLANLVVPALYMSRLWRASIDVKNWGQRHTPVLLWVCWLVWVLRLTTLYLFLHTSLVETRAQEIRLYQTTIWHDLICLLSLALFLAVILSISRAQQRQFGD